MDSCPRSSGKRIPPKVPRKPVRQLPATSTKPKSLLAREAQPTVPSRLKPVAENRHASTQHNVNMRQVYNVEAQFKRLQNVVPFEVSTKIAVLRKKRTNDNIWKTCVENILHESRQNRESQSRHKAIEEKSDRLRQNIDQEKYKFFTFQDEIQLEKTKTEKQIRVLQEDKCCVEASLKSAENDNEKLNKKLEESQFVVDNLKALNQDTEICKLYQIVKELNNEVRKYKEMEDRHHQENYEIKERNEALSTELALSKRCLKELEGETSFYKQKLKKTKSQIRGTKKKLEETEPYLKLSLTETEEKLKASKTNLKEAEAKQTDQATYYKQNLNETESRLRESEKKLEERVTSFKLSLRETEEKLKATATKLKEAETKQTDQATYYEQNLNEAESRLRETEKKLEEIETSFKLSLRESEEKLKATETKLKEAEARLTVAQEPLDETEAVVKTEERKAWREEVQSLTNQIQEQSRLIEGLSKTRSSEKSVDKQAGGDVSYFMPDHIKKLAERTELDSEFQSTEPAIE